MGHGGVLFGGELGGPVYIGVSEIGWEGGGAHEAEDAAVEGGEFYGAGDGEGEDFVAAGVGVYGLFEDALGAAAELIEGGGAVGIAAEEIENGEGDVGAGWRAFAIDGGKIGEASAAHPAGGVFVEHIDGGFGLAEGVFEAGCGEEDVIATEFIEADAGEAFNEIEAFVVGIEEGDTEGASFVDGERGDGRGHRSEIADADHRDILHCIGSCC